MIDREHDLPVTKQAKVLRISRGSVYYRARPVSATDLEVMRRLDRLHLAFPFAGSRMLQGLLSADGCKIGRRHVKQREGQTKRIVTSQTLAAGGRAMAGNPRDLL